MDCADIWCREGWNLRRPIAPMFAHCGGLRQAAPTCAGQPQRNAAQVLCQRQINAPMLAQRHCAAQSCIRLR
eukprot:2626302-Alexandrium_andersonii.AAC.1